jgi:hypothetical protein
VQKLSPGTVTNHLCALRSFYIQTLKKPWSIADTPYPKKRHRLPTILSQEEVAQLIDAAPTAFYRTVAGTVLGLACAVATGYILRSRFYGAHSTSLSVLFGSALLLIGPALIAIALPARRAAFQDPAETLRRE